MCKTVDWVCPQCGEGNTDITDQGTHCAYCGRVVWVGNEDGQIWNEGWNVEMPANTACTRLETGAANADSESNPAVSSG